MKPIHVLDPEIMSLITYYYTYTDTIFFVVNTTEKQM